MEPVPPAALVEDALRMNAAAFERHRVQVIQQFDEDVPPAMVDRHKVLQILINLLRNAKYAMDEQAPAEKRLEIHVSQAARGNVAITVQRQRHWHRAGKSHAHFWPRLHHQEGRPWIRPAQRSAGRQTNERLAERPQRRPGPRSHFYFGTASRADRGQAQQRTDSNAMAERQQLKHAMDTSMLNPNHRILIVDDNPAIHADFRKILCPAQPDKSEIQDLKAALFDKAPRPSQRRNLNLFPLSRARRRWNWSSRRSPKIARTRWLFWMCACLPAGMASKPPPGSGRCVPTSRSSSAPPTRTIRGTRCAPGSTSPTASSSSKSRSTTSRCSNWRMR